MAIIETEIWKPNPERPGTLIFDSSRLAQDVFNDLETHLTAAGRMPDEYFLLNTEWRDGKPFPKDAALSCEVNFGGSEGIYLDISIAYKKDVYEYSRENGELGWHNRTVIERFATGKTLGESNDDLDRMNLAASSVTAAFYGYENGVHARYAVVQHSETEKTAKTLFRDVKPGDWVISAGNNDYAYLIGIVKDITKVGTPEHAAETDNDTDNIHVDFTVFDYPPDRVEEIEEHFNDLYDEPKTFDELPLDDVIMAPKMLIGITHLGQDEITRMGNLRQNCESFCNCFMGGGNTPLSDRETALVERVEKNYADYQKSLLGFGKQELIDMAGKISAMSDAYSYMTCWHGFGEDELDFYLEFQNPLEVLADEWRERQSDLSDMSFAMEHAYQNSGSLLEQYPVIHDSEAPADIGLRRFMGVDLIDFLGKISEKTIIHYPNDWNIDIDALRRYSMFEDFDERRLVWHVCSMGTHLKPERDVFIRDSGSHEYMTDYHQNDADMFGYYIEITGRDGQSIIGNVFEVGNYADFAAHLRLNALPLDSVTLTYSPDWGGANAGKVLTVSRREYDDDRHRLMSLSGRVTELTFHPKDAQELYRILRDERVYRMSFPIGSQEAHLQRLAEKLAEIRKPVVETPPNEKAARLSTAKKKPSLTARLAEAGAEAKAYNAQRAQNPANIAKNNKKEIE